jgi:hypothetical protein
MPFDATGFEEDIPPQRRRLRSDEKVGLIVLPIPTALVCWAAWGVLRAAADAVGWACFALALAYVALAVTTAAVVCWPQRILWWGEK